MRRPLDTSDEARHRQVAILRSMPPSQRLEIALAMSDDVRAIAAAGIARRHPEWTPAQRAAGLEALVYRSGRR